MILTPRRLFLVLSGLLLLLLVSMLLALSVGSVSTPPHLSWESLIEPGKTNQMEGVRTILWDIRFPRIFLAICVGMALSVAGASFQALLRNPLADPHVLGVSCGAALGALLSIFFKFLGGWSTPLASFAGALVTML
jgi:iron complex transport system permease protein